MNDSYLTGSQASTRPRPFRQVLGSRRAAWAHRLSILALAGLVPLVAAGGQTYTQPLGQLTITTPEGSATFTGPNNNPDSNPVLQCRAGSDYSVSSYCWTPAGGSFDPQGAVGVERYYSIRHGGNLYDAQVQVLVTDKDWPANSGLGKTRTYGPYTADLYLDLKSGQTFSASVPYLKETIILGYYNKQTRTRTAVLASGNVYVFPPAAQSTLSLTTPSSQVGFNNLATNKALNSNTPLGGDPPVIQAKLSNLYPGGSSYLRIYPGKQSSSPQNVTVIPNTTATAPWGDLSSRTLLIPIGPYLSQPGFYTVEAIQQIPAYGTDPVLQNSATFNAGLNFSVHADVGTVQH